MNLVETKSSSALAESLAGQVVDAMNESIIAKLLSPNRAATHNGVSVWLPGLSDHISAEQAYRQLTMSRQTKWDELLQKVLKARGIVTFATTPIEGPYNGVDCFVSDLSKVQDLTNNLASLQNSYGLIINENDSYLKTDQPIAEDLALGFALKAPTDWESPPRWRITFGFTVAHFADPFFPDNNAQASTSGWSDRKGIFWTQWFPFLITTDGKLGVLNKQLGYCP